MKHKQKVTTNHTIIRHWTARRRGRPARSRRRIVNREDALRINFPDMIGDEAFELVAWREFFRAFEKNQLAFLHQDRTLDGALSRFNLFVERNDHKRIIH